jgi:hypothetical protein
MYRFEKRIGLGSGFARHGAGRYMLADHENPGLPGASQIPPYNPNHNRFRAITTGKGEFLLLISYA